MPAPRKAIVILRKLFLLRIFEASHAHSLARTFVGPNDPTKVGALRQNIGAVAAQTQRPRSD